MAKQAQFIMIIAVLSDLAIGRVFRMGLLCPKNEEYEFNCYTSAAAVSIALETVQSNPSYNAGGEIELSIHVRDSNCDSKMTGGGLVDLYHNHSIDFIIGPPCSQAAKSAAELTSFFNIPHISWLATSSDLTDKVTYSTFARTFGPFNKMGLFLMDILAKYNWSTVALISSTFQLWEDLGLAVQRVLEDSNGTISFMADYVRFPTLTYITNTLLQIKERARIVIMTVPSIDRRRFMLKAFDLGMCEGDFVFYTLDAIPDDTDNFQNIPIWKGSDGRNVDARRAFESVFQVTIGSRAETVVNVFRLEVAQRMKKEPWKSLFPKAGQFSLGDRFSPYLHDAVILYAIALNETLRQGQDPHNGTVVINNMKLKYFKGMSGNVVLDEQGDRDPDFWVLDMDPEDGSFRKMAQLINRDDGLREFQDLLPPHWPTGETGVENAPRDVPECGFRNQLCPEEPVDVEAVAIAISVTIVGLAGLTGIILVLYRKMMFEKSLKSQVWRVNFAEIEMHKVGGGRTSRGSDKSSNSDAHSNPGSANSGLMRTNVIDLNPSVGGSMGKSMQSMGTYLSQIFTEVGFFKGNLISVKTVHKEHIQLTRSVLMEFLDIRSVRHDNLNNFVGACLEPPNICILWDYCPKGSILDVIMNDSIKLDNLFKLSFISDIAKGMSYIHSSKLGSHGNLKSSNCLVNARWNVKITDYGLPTVLANQKLDENEQQTYKRKLWTAPEILRENFPSANGSQAGDVYSFAIVCFEIITRSEPFSFDTMTCRDVVNRIRNGESIPFRPALPTTHDIGQKLLALVQSCWSETPEDRPTFSQIVPQLRKISKGDINIINTVLKMLEVYTTNLEAVVEERTAQVTEEKEKTDKLLNKLLPSSVAEALKSGQTVKPENYDQASLYFSDIVGFTSIAADSEPMQIVDFLNDLYSVFDTILSGHDVYKVETIGDAYMVVSGVPVRNGARHVAEAANVALDLLSAVTSFRIKHRPQTQLRIRIGLHSGSVVAGVVGLTMPRYCLFGNTVNFAGKMESNGKPLRIHMSKTFHDLLIKNWDDYSTVRRKKNINIPGKGLIQTYWLQGKLGYEKPLPPFEQLTPTKHAAKDESIDDP